MLTLRSLNGRKLSCPNLERRLNVEHDHNDVVNANRTLDSGHLESTLEEFSVFELDERLEFVAWCDTNCVCTCGSGGSCS